MPCHFVLQHYGNDFADKAIFGSHLIVLYTYTSLVPRSWSSKHWWCLWTWRSLPTLSWSMCSCSNTWHNWVWAIETRDLYCLCMHGPYTPTCRSPDLVIFVMTDKTDCFTPCVCTWGMFLCLPFTRSYSSFTHIVLFIFHVDTAPIVHALDHMTPSFMHQRAHVRGINCTVHVYTIIL